MKTLKNILFQALTIFLLLTLISGVLYPGFITVIAETIFPKQAHGSIIEIDGKKYGSELLAQQFTDDKYLWGRIMNLDFTMYKDSNGEVLLYANPSNDSVTSDNYKELVAKRVELIKKANPDEANTAVPVDLVTCSGSGLDPDISPLAAYYQVKRIAKVRSISEAQVIAIIKKCTEGRFLGIFGEERVNVLKVNLMLDGIIK